MATGFNFDFGGGAASGGSSGAATTFNFGDTNFLGASAPASSGEKKDTTSGFTFGGGGDSFAPLTSTANSGSNNNGANNAAPNISNAGGDAQPAKWGAGASAMQLTSQNWQETVDQWDREVNEMKQKYERKAIKLLQWGKRIEQNELAAEKVLQDINQISVEQTTVINTLR